jgi:hypothetical protein
MCVSNEPQAGQSTRPTVECYSGHAYAGEPRAVTWQGRRYVVARVEARWRTPAGPTFRIGTVCGARFEVCYQEAEDRWSVLPLEAYQSYEDKEVLE